MNTIEINYAKDFLLVPIKILAPQKFFNLVIVLSSLVLLADLVCHVNTPPLVLSPAVHASWPAPEFCSPIFA